MNKLRFIEEKDEQRLNQHKKQYSQFGPSFKPGTEVESKYMESPFTDPTAGVRYQEMVLDPLKKRQEGDEASEMGTSQQLLGQGRRNPGRLGSMKSL